MKFMNQGHFGLPDPAEDYLGYARVRISGIDSFNWTHAPALFILDSLRILLRSRLP